MLWFYNNQRLPPLFQDAWVDNFMTASRIFEWSRSTFNRGIQIAAKTDCRSSLLINLLEKVGVHSANINMTTKAKWTTALSAAVPIGLFDYMDVDINHGDQYQKTKEVAIYASNCINYWNRQKMARMLLLLLLLLLGLLLLSNFS